MVNRTGTLGTKGLVCAAHLWENILAGNKFMDAGFGGGLLRDIEGGAEITGEEGQTNRAVL